MLKILRDKFISLGRDEDGAALVVTLAVFMFIYVIFAGIYAVGTNVRTRIHLQNACDAAAYSAAVVQADTLSRIATINRAMSWTYVQMTRRQMDYIVYKWLDHAHGHYIADRRAAEEWHNGSGAGCPNGHGSWPNGWFIGADGFMDNMRLNNWQYAHYESGIGNALQDFNNRHMNVLTNRLSFYSIGSGTVDLEQLQTQIQFDKTTILSMNAAVRSLANNMVNRINSAARNIANSNGVEHCEILQNGSPLGASGYLQYLSNNDGDELRFARFSDSTVASINALFGTGINSWFVHSNRGRGIQRLYSQSASALLAEWEWWSAKWNCYLGAYGSWVHAREYYTGYCPHRECADTCTRNGILFRAILRAGDISDDCYTGASARPLVMNNNYFGSAGTITVGLVATNANPWAWIGGIFSAFNPFVSQTFCVASAKAGYRNFTVGQNFGRDYRIDWRSGDSLDPDDEQYWNLYTSDWDAVMVPVPRAASSAVNGSWGVAVPDALSGIAARLGLGAGDFTAGGAGNAQWQIENPGQAIGSWGALQGRMWH